MAAARIGVNCAALRAGAVMLMIGIISGATSPKEALRQVSVKSGAFHNWDSAALAHYAQLVGFPARIVSKLETNEVTGSLFLELDEGILQSWGVNDLEMKRFMTARQELADAAASETRNEKSSLIALRALNRRGFSLGLTFLQSAPHASALYYGVFATDNALRMFGDVDGGAKVSFNWLVWIIAPETFFIRHMWRFLDTDFFVSFALITSAVVSLVGRIISLKGGYRGFLASVAQQTGGTLVTLCVYYILWPVIPFFIVDMFFYIGIVGGLCVAAATVAWAAAGVTMVNGAVAWTAAGVNALIEDQSGNTIKSHVD